MGMMLGITLSGAHPPYRRFFLANSDATRMSSGPIILFSDPSVNPELYDGVIFVFAQQRVNRNVQR
jgi:hypothetical protein